MFERTCFFPFRLKVNQANNLEKEEPKPKAFTETTEKKCQIDFGKRNGKKGGKGKKGK